MSGRTSPVNGGYEAANAEPAMRLTVRKDLFPDPRLPKIISDAGSSEEADDVSCVKLETDFEQSIDDIAKQKHIANGVMSSPTKTRHRKHKQHSRRHSERVNGCISPETKRRKSSSHESSPRSPPAHVNLHRRVKGGKNLNLVSSSECQDEDEDWEEPVEEEESSEDEVLKCSVKLPLINVPRQSGKPYSHELSQLSTKKSKKNSSKERRTHAVTPCSGKPRSMLGICSSRSKKKSKRSSECTPTYRSQIVDTDTKLKIKIKRTGIKDSTSITPMPVSMVPIPSVTSISDLGQRKSKKKRVASPVQVSSGEEYDPRGDGTAVMSVGAPKPRQPRPKTLKTKKSKNNKNKDKSEKTERSRISGAQVQDSGPQSPWAQMPEEILEKIFEYVVSSQGTLPTVIRLGKVCKRWHSVSCRPQLWKNVDLTQYIKEKCKTDFKLVWLLENRLTQCHSLNIAQWEVSNITWVLACIADYCPGLVELSVAGWSRITPEQLFSLLQGLTQLQRLDLSLTSETGGSSTCLSAASMARICENFGARLTHLTLANNKFTALPQILSSVAAYCVNLEVLDISGAQAISHPASVPLEALQKGCPKMRVFRAANSQLVLANTTTSQMMETNGWTQLEELSIAGDAATERGCVGEYKLGDEALERLVRGATRLRLLDLRGLQRLTDSGLVRVPAWDLQHLFLGGQCVSEYKLDEALERLVRGATRLRLLDLRGLQRLTDSGLVRVPAWDLQHLFLGGQCVSEYKLDEALERLVRGATRLRLLDLRGLQRLTDSGLVRVPAWDLQHLFLGGQCVSEYKLDEALERLVRGATRLRLLDLRGLQRLTDSGLVRVPAWDLQHLFLGGQCVSEYKLDEALERLVRGATRLRLLDLRGLQRLTDSGLVRVPAWDLQHLFLGGQCVSEYKLDEALERLVRGATRLRLLDLRGLQRLTDSGLVRVPAWDLQHLFLGGQCVSEYKLDEALERLVRGATRLRLLDLRGLQRLTDSGLVRVPAWDLQHLFLGGQCVSEYKLDEALERLVRGATRLRLLDLRGLQRLTDSGLVRVPAWDLQHLFLGGQCVSEYKLDEALERLVRGATRLRLLDLRGLQRLTDSGLVRVPAWDLQHLFLGGQCVSEYKLDEALERLVRGATRLRLLDLRGLQRLTDSGLVRVPAWDLQHLFLGGQCVSEYKLDEALERLVRGATRLRLLDLRGLQRLTDSGLVRVPAWDLQHLFLGGQCVSEYKLDEALERLVRGATRLRLLDLRGLQRLTDSGLVRVPAWDLQHLFLGGQCVSEYKLDEALERLVRGATRLRLLDLRGLQRLTDSGLVRVPAWDLQHLFLGGQCVSEYKLDEALERLVRGATRLRLLDLRGLQRLTDSGLVRVPAWDLQHLFLGGQCVSEYKLDEALERLVRGATRLRLLDLRGLQRLTDSGLVRVPAWDLQHLFLGGQCVSEYKLDEALERLVRGATRLRLLDLRGLQRLTDSGLVRVPAWDLQHLFLGGCNVTRQSSACLELICEKWSHSLLELDLSWASAARALDDAVAALADCSRSRLRILNLCGSSVSLEPVKKVLLRCPHLESINLSSCRALPRGMKRLYTGKELQDLKDSLDPTKAKTKEEEKDKTKKKKKDVKKSEADSKSDVEAKSSPKDNANDGSGKTEEKSQETSSSSIFQEPKSVSDSPISRQEPTHGSTKSSPDSKTSDLTTNKEAPDNSLVSKQSTGNTTPKLLSPLGQSRPDSSSTPRSEPGKSDVGSPYFSPVPKPDSQILNSPEVHPESIKSNNSWNLGQFKTTPTYKSEASPLNRLDSYTKLKHGKAIEQCSPTTSHENKPSPETLGVRQDMKTPTWNYGSPMTRQETQFSSQRSPYSAQPSPAQPSPYSTQPSPYSTQPSPYSSQPSPYSAQPSPDTSQVGKAELGKPGAWPAGRGYAAPPAREDWTLERFSAPSVESLVWGAAPPAPPPWAPDPDPWPLGPALDAFDSHVLQTYLDDSFAESERAD